MSMKVLTSVIILFQTFFLRYAGDNFAFVCKKNRNCEISITSRTHCKFCRYQKCLMVGMCRKGLWFYLKMIFEYFASIKIISIEKFWRQMTTKMN